MGDSEDTVVAKGITEAHRPQSTESVSRVVLWIIARMIESVRCRLPAARP